MKKQLWIGCAIIISLSACSPPENKPNLSLEVEGKFQSKSYPINDNEYVTALEIPDNIIPDRCWVYTNLRTNTSVMRCDVGDEKEFPVNGNQ